jgi:hypothetical protein
MSSHNPEASLIVLKLQAPFLLYKPYQVVAFPQLSREKGFD